jgi:hypothetical protein
MPDHGAGSRKMLEKYFGSFIDDIFQKLQAISNSVIQLFDVNNEVQSLKIDTESNTQFFEA